jgi:hypothetical protein
MVQGGGEVPSNPLPKESGPWVVTAENGRSESILWSRADARTYTVRLGGQENQNLMLIGVGGGEVSHSMAAARYTSNHRQGTPVCLVCNLYSGYVTDACDHLFRALSEYAVIGRLTWPLWAGLATMDGSARPRGNAGGLRLLDSELYDGTALYVPAMFGVEGSPPPS